MAGYYPNAESYLFSKAERPDEAMRQILEMMMMSKQLEAGREKEAWERQMQERQVSAEEMLRKSQMAREMRPEVQKPSALEEKIQAFMAVGYDRKTATELATIGRPPQPEKDITPTLEKEYRTKKSEISRYYARETNRLEEERRKQLADLKTDFMFQQSPDKDSILMQFKKQYDVALSALKEKEQLEISDLMEEFSSLPQFKGKKKTSTTKPIITKPATIQKPDEFGFSVGEERQAPDGHIYKYLGNNKWQMVR